MRQRLLSAALDAALLSVAFAAGWLTTSDVIVALWLEAVVLAGAVPLLLVTAGRRISRRHPHRNRAPAPGTDPHRLAGFTMTVNGRRRRYYGQKAAWAGASFFVVHFGGFTAATGAITATVVGGLDQVTTPLWLLAVRAATSRAGYLVRQWQVLAADDFAAFGTKVNRAMGLPYLYLMPLFGATMWIVDHDVAVSTPLVVAVVVAAGMLTLHPKVPAPPPPDTSAAAPLPPPPAAHPQPAARQQAAAAAGPAPVWASAVADAPRPQTRAKPALVVVGALLGGFVLAVVGGLAALVWQTGASSDRTMAVAARFERYADPTSSGHVRDGHESGVVVYTVDGVTWTLRGAAVPAEHVDGELTMCLDPDHPRRYQLVVGEVTCGAAPSSAVLESGLGGGPAW